MSGWMLGRMDGWMDERRGRVQREKRQQQLRTRAKMKGGGGWSFTFWAHDITLFFSILPFSPFFHICRAGPFHAHIHTLCLIVQARDTSGSIRTALFSKVTLPLPVPFSMWVVGASKLSFDFLNFVLTLWLHCPHLTASRFLPTKSCVYLSMMNTGHC